MNNTIILIPTYNEKENITKIIPRIFEFTPDVSVMVIDDNSPDGTAAAVKKLQEKYVNLQLYQRSKKEGLGKAYMDAFQKVIENDDVEFICTMDADLSHNPKYLPNMLKVAQQNDYAVGSRYVSGGSIAGWEIRRKILSSLGNRYVRMVTKIPVKDCTSGFGCIRISLLKKINFSDFDTSGYAFLIYLKYKAWKNNARIHEIPICFKNRVTGESKITMDIISEGLFLPWKLIKKINKDIKQANCPLCKKNTNFWFTKNNTDVYKCKSCKLIFIYPVPNNLDEIYSKNYFCGASEGFGYINYDEDKKVNNEEFKKYLKKIEIHHPTKGKILDIGAATGSFLQTAKDFGWDTKGIEISEYASKKGREKGIDIQAGTLEEFNFEPESFDVITMWDVFEHIQYPEKTLQKIHTLLKPDGLLVINMPDAGSFYAQLMGKFWALIIPPEHLMLYTKENFDNLLKKYNLSILHKGTIGKKFKLAYIFQILYTMRHQKIWKKISDLVKKTFLDKFYIPINLHDNMFLIIKKDK